MLSPFVSHIPPSPQPNTARRRSADEWNIPACRPHLGTDPPRPPPPAPDTARRLTRPQAVHEPRVVLGLAVRPPHPCDALANGNDRAPVEPAREAAWTPPSAALSGTGLRCPDRNALGALRRAQAAAGRSSTRGRVGRRGGRTNDRPRGSAHVDGVKARRARAAAPSPPARLPAGRDEAGHHRTDRTAFDASRNARRRTKPKTSPARPPATSAPAEPPREAACTPPHGTDALRAHHRPPRDPHDAPRDPRPPTNPESVSGFRSASWPPARVRHRSGPQLTLRDTAGKGGHGDDETALLGRLDQHPVLVDPGLHARLDGIVAHYGTTIRPVPAPSPARPSRCPAGPRRTVRTRIA